MRILVDAMGGDNAPESVVNGCIDAINELDGYEVLLIGDRQKINRILQERKFDNPRLKVQHTTEVITNDDLPTKAIKSKKNSSMVVGFNLLKEKKGDAFISAGNSGALLTGALLILKRIKGIDRPVLPAIIPTKTGKALIIDAGLNSSCKPENYMEFGVLGSIYMKHVLGIDHPKVGLVNIGIEEKKGPEAIKQAYSLLANSNIHFIGNIEGNDILEGKAHIAVCDGFVGNVMLKFLEGAASFFFGSLKEIYTKNTLSKVSGLMIKKEMKQFAARLDRDENGGAPILGVDGNVIKSHGNSTARTIKHVVKKAYYFANSSVLEQIRQEFK